MSLDLKEDDPVTVYGEERSIDLETVQVAEDISLIGISTAETAFRTKPGNYLLFDDEEGVLWIRGHHAEDSLEVHAMLTACALRFNL